MQYNCTNELMRLVFINNQYSLQYNFISLSVRKLFPLSIQLRYFANDSCTNPKTRINDKGLQKGPREVKSSSQLLINTIYNLQFYKYILSTSIHLITVQNMTLRIKKVKPSTEKQAIIFFQKQILSRQICVINTWFITVLNSIGEQNRHGSICG